MLEQGLQDGVFLFANDSISFRVQRAVKHAKVSELSGAQVAEEMKKGCQNTHGDLY